MMLTPRNTRLSFTTFCRVVVLASFVCQVQGQIGYPEKEVSVSNLPALTASSSDPTDVLATSLETIIHRRTVCCGKDSALEDSVQRADPKSLKDVANRLEGRHLLSDGRPIAVTTEFLAANEVKAGHIISMLQNRHAPLMEWDSQLYVVRGVTYVESINAHGSTSRTDTVHTFLLEDVRYSDARRQVIFDRTKENAAQVQGLLFVEWQAQ